MFGNGLLVEQERLHLAMGVRPENFSFDKFRHMCILSGCDYLPSLPGIGLSKACKFITRTVDPDVHRVSFIYFSRKFALKKLSLLGIKPQVAITINIYLGILLSSHLLNIIILLNEKFNAFYIVETSQMLSKRVNGYRSTCTVVNCDLPVPIYTQSHQLPFQEC